MFPRYGREDVVLMVVVAWVLVVTVVIVMFGGVVVGGEGRQQRIRLQSCEIVLKGNFFRHSATKHLTED